MSVVAGRAARRLAREICQLGPSLLLRRYSRKATAQGIDRLYLVLSFDCDTDRDSEVVESICDFLADHGVRPVFAVPGELLECRAAIYQRLCARGYGFINHGYRTHTVLEGDSYVSCLFYNRMSAGEIVEDIRMGHEALQQVLGVDPSGFRVPHFATFQSSDQLAWLHQTLRDMGYRFSSSTMPVYGLRYGVGRHIDGVWELPVSGCYDAPLQILDSYSFRFASGRRWAEDNYCRQFSKMVDFFVDSGLPGVLNYYVDPSQVHDFTGFYDAIEYCMSRSVVSVDFSALVGRLDVQRGTEEGA